MGNPVTWFEINGASPADASRFYTDLFGWQTQTLPGDYIMVDTGAGRGMNGGFGTTAPGPAGAVFYAQGPDLQALLDRATQLGGVMVMPVTEIPDMVTYAHFRDPWDNTIGLVKGDIDQIPAITGGDNPAMDWFEITCTEPEKAIDFYRSFSAGRSRRIRPKASSTRALTPVRAAGRGAGSAALRTNGPTSCSTPRSPTCPRTWAGRIRSGRPP